MAVVGLCIVVAARKRAKAEPGVVRRRPREGPVFWGKRVAFYALVALCLNIPSGWTQQVLEEFEARRDVASPVVTVCGSERGLSHS